MTNEERKNNIEETGSSGVLTNKQRIYICVSLLGILVILLALYVAQGGFKFIKTPKVDNHNFQIETLTVDGKDYDLATYKLDSPTKGQLLDAAGFDIQTIQTSETASGTVEQSQTSKQLNSEERKEPIKLLKEYVDFLNNNSVYIILNYNSSTTAVMNNRLGEEISEADDGSLNIINANGTTYQAGDTEVLSGPTISTVNLLGRVLNRAEEDPDHVEFKAVDAGNGYVSYQVIFDSPDSFVEIYDNLTEETRGMLAADIYNQASQYSENTPKICFEIIAGDDWAISVYNTIVIDDEYVLNWYFDGYYEMFDWQLPKEFYGDEFTIESYKNATMDLMENVQDIIDIYSNTQKDPDTGKLVYNAENSKIQTPESQSVVSEDIEQAVDSTSNTQSSEDQ